jgi:hypothetical protein
MNIIEAIRKINENKKDIDFRVTFNNHEKTNFEKRHKLQYYLEGRNWCGNMFIRWIEITDDKHVKVLDAIPVHENIDLIETEELKDILDNMNI